MIVGSVSFAVIPIIVYLLSYQFFPGNAYQNCTHINYVCAFWLAMGYLKEKCIPNIRFIKIGMSAPGDFDLIDIPNKYETVDMYIIFKIDKKSKHTKLKILQTWYN